MQDEYKKKAASIILVQLPKKLTYFVGAKTIDPKEGQICAIYQDGSHDMVQMDDPDVHIKFDSASEGQKIATLSH